MPGGWISSGYRFGGKVKAFGMSFVAENQRLLEKKISSVWIRWGHIGVVNILQTFWTGHLAHPESDTISALDPAKS